MSLSESTLATELEQLTPGITAQEAVQAIAQAYGAYMDGALAGTIPIITTTPAIASMVGAMSFSSSGSAISAGATIQAGMTAFWAAMVASPPAYFAACTAITPPPGLSALGTSLAAVFASNLSLGLSLQDAAEAMAATIDAATESATAAFPPSSVFKIG